MAFRAVGTPMDEMILLKRLRDRDPESASNVVANGQLMVEWAGQGNVKKLQCALDHMDESRVLLFYAVRMFRHACSMRRLDVLQFMFENGFDIQMPCIRDVLHVLIEQVSSTKDTDTIQPVIRFLVDHGVDVNWQRPGDLYTALHIACKKNLYGIAYLLILYDADVNAIASNDEMPLVSAESMELLGREPSALDKDQNHLLISLLHDCGARRTWRKPKPVEVDIRDLYDSTSGGGDIINPLGSRMQKLSLSSLSETSPLPSPFRGIQLDTDSAFESWADPF